MEKLPKEEKDFYTYMDKLNEMYEVEPKKVSKEVREALIRLNAFEQMHVLGDIDIDKLVLCLLVIGIAFIGLFNISNFPMYLFGLVFFIAGHFIGLYVNVFGLIFLFSHSVTGIVIMETTLLGDLFQLPIMSDNPQNVYIYLGINIALLVVATVIVILHNLSNSFKAKRHIVFVPLIIYALAFIMSGILPRIVNFIYAI